MAGLPQKRRFIILGFVLLLAVWGALQRMSDIQPAQHSLLTRPDWRAANWIRDHLPADARFLVNSFPAFGAAQVGSDGGWWLPLTADRWANIPPLSYGFEKEALPGDWEQIFALPAAIRELGIDAPQVRSVLAERGISYVYIGQLQGSSNSPYALLDLGQIRSSPYFREIYHQDRVWIFERLTPQIGVPLSVIRFIGR